MNREILNPGPVRQNVYIKRHPSEISEHTTTLYLKSIQNVMTHAQVPPDRNRYFYAEASEEGLNVKLSLSLGRDVASKWLWSMSQFIISKPDQTEFNQLSVSWDNISPWGSGSCKPEDSRYVRDYVPKDEYLDLVSQYIEELSSKNLFKSSPPFTNLVNLPQ